MQGLVTSYIDCKAHLRLLLSHCNAHTRPNPSRRGLLTIPMADQVEDPEAWKRSLKVADHFSSTGSGNNKDHKCKWCLRVIKGSVSRCIDHLLGQLPGRGRAGSSQCPTVTEAARMAMRTSLIASDAQKAAAKRMRETQKELHQGSGLGDGPSSSKRPKTGPVSCWHWCITGIPHSCSILTCLLPFIDADNCSTVPSRP